MAIEIKKVVKKLPLSSKIKKFLRRTAKSPFLYFTATGTGPLSNYYGMDRGEPLDRYYVEKFLGQHKESVKGSCLEVLNNPYTLKYGGEKVTKSDILDIEETNREATIIDDLRHLTKIADNTYDCIILTQVLQFIDDLDAAISECHRILKDNGVLLVTLPSVSRIDCSSGISGDYWRFTTASAKYLFEKKFKPEKIYIHSQGNARAGIYFYAGLSQEDTSAKVLDANDPNFPLIVTVKATK